MIEKAVLQIELDFGRLDLRATKTTQVSAWGPDFMRKRTTLDPDLALCLTALAA
jgi:hypothetical protein